MDECRLLMGVDALVSVGSDRHVTATVFQAIGFRSLSAAVANTSNAMQYR